MKPWEGGRRARLGACRVRPLAGIVAALASAGCGTLRWPLPALTDRHELVMTPGTRITATTANGTISVYADTELKRSYTWEGATRSVVMWPRDQRWIGSYGLYFPGPGNHWRNHNGIRRGCVGEGQQHFGSVERAVEWIRHPSQQYQKPVYRDDGLVVGWGTVLFRDQLNVDVWQIVIDGKRPTSLPGSNNDAIQVEGALAPVSGPADVAEYWGGTDYLKWARGLPAGTKKTGGLRKRGPESQRKKTEKQ